MRTHAGPIFLSFLCYTLRLEPTPVTFYKQMGEYGWQGPGRQGQVHAGMRGFFLLYAVGIAWCLRSGGAFLQDLSRGIQSRVSKLCPSSPPGRNGLISLAPRMTRNPPLLSGPPIGAAILPVD